MKYGVENDFEPADDSPRTIGYKSLGDDLEPTDEQKQIHYLKLALMRLENRIKRLEQKGK